MDDCVGGFFSQSDSGDTETGSSGAATGISSPERRLLLAILERAILDYVGNDSREVAAAEDWLFNEERLEKASDQFSFAWVCEQLDLDTFKVAHKIRSMPRRGSRKVAPWYFAKETVHAL
jgi:hypothetical protein